MDKPIIIVPHGPDPISVRAGGRHPEIRILAEAEREPPDLGEELTLPELLRALPPGELTRVEPSAESGTPMLFVAHGAEVDLGREPKLLREAISENREIEIHVYGSPDDAGGR